MKATPMQSQGRPAPAPAPQGDFHAFLRERCWRQNFLKGYVADAAAMAAIFITACLLHWLAAPMPLLRIGVTLAAALALIALPTLSVARRPRADPGPPLVAAFLLLAVSIASASAQLDAAVGAPAAVFTGFVLAAFWVSYAGTGGPALARPAVTAAAFALSYTATLGWAFPGPSFGLALSTSCIGGTLLGWFAATAHYRSLRSSYDLSQALEQALEQAKGAAQAKADFLANMSHEIRTPLNGVLGSLSLMERCELREEAREHLAISQASGKAVLSIINDILDYSKIEAGKLELEERPYDLVTLVEEAVRISRAGAAGKSVELRAELDPAMPRQVLGDDNRLRQVLLNLLNNALKFTERGSVVLRAGVARKDGDCLEVAFAVEDTGIGMNPEQLGRLFRPFVQADSSTTRRFGGSGLGLTICKQVVQCMGGEIWVESERGAGSTFSFTVRLGCGQGLAGDGVDAAATRRRQPARLEGKLVLVAEDNRVNQMLARKMLEVLGLRVVIASNGQEAVELFPRRRWDLVLMDCQMPVLDGYQATRRIRELEGEGRRTPVVAVTANVMPSDRERGRKAGMDDRLAKPYDLEELTELLHRWLPMEPAEQAAAGRKAGARRPGG